MIMFIIFHHFFSIFVPNDMRVNILSVIYYIWNMRETLSGITYKYI